MTNAEFIAEAKESNNAVSRSLYLGEACDRLEKSDIREKLLVEALEVIAATRTSEDREAKNFQVVAEQALSKYRSQHA